MRKAAIDRVTKETNVRIRLTIEGKGRYKVSTGIRFFDHMLELFAHHGAFDLDLVANGDLDVDQHHTVEDVGIFGYDWWAICSRNWWQTFLMDSRAGRRPMFTREFFTDVRIITRLRHSSRHSHAR